jgi:hypothetical protein
MRSKKSKEPKKYAVGGFVAAGALGGLQALLGAGQMFAGSSAASRIKEAPTARPSEYAELLKQARNAELEQKRLEELNRSIATGISAAQGAGGRALIGALPGMTRAADVGAMDILGQRQAQTMQALQFGAQGSEREIDRKINREMMERGAAQAAIEGGLQNFAGGLGQIGSAAIYSGLGGKKTNAADEGAAAPTMEEQMRTETLASLNRSAGAGSGGERSLIAQNIADLQGQLGEEQVPAFGDIMENRMASLLNPMELPEFMKDRSFYKKEGGMVTGGKFDHKTNPIDIIQQGRKVGEMTGGEVILNPQQQKKLSKESAYFRQLLKKFNKQK